MWGKNIKRRKTDVLFSNYIRERDNWTCQRCRRNFEHDKGRLDCSHYWGRAHESVRFEPDNCIALCRNCHQIWGHGEERDLYEDFMKKKLGVSRWASLLIQAHTYKQKDDKAVLLILKELNKNAKSTGNNPVS